MTMSHLLTAPPPQRLQAVAVRKPTVRPNALRIKVLIGIVLLIGVSQGVCASPASSSTGMSNISGLNRSTHSPLPMQAFVQCGDDTRPLSERPLKSIQIRRSDLSSQEECSIWLKAGDLAFETLAAPSDDSPVEVVFEPESVITFRLPPTVSANDMSVKLKWRDSEAEPWVEVPTAVITPVGADEHEVRLENLREGHYQMEIVSDYDIELQRIPIIYLGNEETRALGEIREVRPRTVCGSVLGWQDALSEVHIHWKVSHAPARAAGIDGLQGSVGLELNGIFCVTHVPATRGLWLWAESERLRSEPIQVDTSREDGDDMLLELEPVPMVVVDATWTDGQPESTLEAFFYRAVRDPTGKATRFVLVQRETVEPGTTVPLDLANGDEAVMLARSRDNAVAVSSFTVGVQDLVLVDFEVGGKLSGIVIDDASGQPVSHASVALFLLVDKGRFFLMSDTTDEDGLFAFSAVPDEEFEITASHPDFRALRDHISTLGEPLPEQGRITLTLDPGFMISGSVVDAATNQPIQGAQVKVFRVPADRQTHWTDSVGEFSIGGLRPGQYAVRVESPGYRQASRRLTASESRPLPTTIQLVRGTQWKGQLDGFAPGPGASIRLLKGAERYEAPLGFEGEFQLMAGPTGRVGYIVQDEMGQTLCSGIVNVPIDAASFTGTLECR